MKTEIPFKRWKMEQAERLGISLGALEMRLHRGSHPRPELRRESLRTMFVKQKESKP